MQSSNPITVDLVRHHLLEMGYDPEALPSSVLDQFVQELSELYESGALDDEVESEGESDYQVMQSIDQEEVVESGRQKIYKSRYQPRRPETVEPVDETLDDDPELLEMLDKLNLQNFKAKVEDHLENVSEWSEPVSFKPKSRPASGCMRDLISH
jgi:hypothetical protein